MRKQDMDLAASRAVISRGQYVLCKVPGDDTYGHGIRAGVTLYRYHNGWIVAMLAGGFCAVLNKSMRAASPAECKQIESDWQDADASRMRVGGPNGKALDALSDMLQIVLKG